MTVPAETVQQLQARVQYLSDIVDALAAKTQLLEHVVSELVESLDLIHGGDVHDAAEKVREELEYQAADRAYERALKERKA